jgi:hypothetical protein
MARKRPAAVTTMALLNIIFGLLCLSCMVCMGMGVLVVLNGQGLLALALVNILADRWEYLAREIPAFPVVEITHLFLVLFLNTLLIIAGIGMLHLRTWAWFMGLLYSIVMLLAGIGMVIFTVVVVGPAAQRWQQDFQNRLNQPGAGGANAESGLHDPFGLMMQLILVIYAGVQLILILLPNVRTAFAGGPALEDSWPGESGHGDSEPPGRPYNS